MIGSYLHSLYSNCKAISKTGDYNFERVEHYFQGCINDVLKNNNFKNEEELLSYLISSNYNTLSTVLDSCPPLHIFYLVNSFSEYDKKDTALDELNRLKYSGSLQIQTGVTNNLVLNLIKKSLGSNETLSTSYKITHHKSYFFLSHDIDSVYGSFMQDGLWAIKNGRVDVMLTLFFNVLQAKPHWLNFDLIMKTESEYDFKSTFYWLVNQGKIDARQTNSDYNISSKEIVSAIKKVSENRFENGLHKSISTDSFKTELAKFPTNVSGNRYHYLKFQLPDSYNKIEEAGLKLEASLGFAEHYGFRNNYGYPFHPYNVNTKTNYSFLEVPLNVMDGTFQRYLKIPVENTADTIINFLEKNKEDTLLSILWHNTFFSNYKYKGYLAEYKKILKYLYESKFQNINQNEIISKFSWQSK